MTEHRTKLTVEQQVPYLPNPIIYTPEMFGYHQFKGKTGEGVRVCIIDSGVPEHDAIPNVVDAINFTDSEDEKDAIGHATLAAGIIGANKDTAMVGLAPHSLLYFGKMVSDDSTVRFDSFVAAVLWGIIQEVDIIVILFSTDIHHPALHDAIKKAYNSGICIVSSAEENTYPSSYDEVLSFGASSKGIDLQVGPLFSAYTDNGYAKGNGLSVITSVGAGLCALTIEEKMKSNLKYKPIEIYDAMKNFERKQ